MNITYKRFCFPVTLRCNLRCQHCAERSPYYENPYHPKVKELIKYIDGLFQLVEYIDKFDITGGEPFLREDLPMLVEYIYNHYSSQIGMLRVTTNGTLLPPKGFLEAAKLWGDAIYVIVDCYTVSYKSKEVFEIFHTAGIPAEQRDYSSDLHCDGWVDYGDLTPKHTREEARRLFQRCMVPKLGFFSCLVNGIVFPCAKARLLYEHFIVNIAINIFDDTLTENGKKARLKSLLGEEVVEACRYCNGLCEESQRVTPAEQLQITKKQAQKMMDYEDWKLDYGKLLIYTQTYNNEKTIARTMTSVMNQTNKNYTYFVCNNGSTDGTGDIIKRLAAGNDRIVHVACERNDILAVKFVPYKLFAFVPRYLDNYYCIVDGDDFLEKDFCQRAMDMINKQAVDMIVPAYNRVSAEYGTVLNTRCLPEDIIITGQQKAENFMAYRPLLLCQWGKIYRWNKYKKLKNLLIYQHYLRVPMWFHQGDTVGVLSIYYQCESVGFISSPVYNYSISSQSTHGTYRPNRIHNDVLMFRIYNDFLEKMGPVQKINRDYCYAIYLSLLYENLNSIFYTKAVSIKQKLADIYDILNAEETKELLTGEFDPVFQNLSKRDSFLNTIRSYLLSLPPDESYSEGINNIEKKLNQYGN